jgi:virginiamycin B lyase
VKITTETIAQTVQLPKVGGYGGTVLIPADTKHPGTVLTLTATTQMPTTVQSHLRAAMATRRVSSAPVYSPMLYVTVSADTASQLFSQPGYNIVLPSGTDTTATAFYLSVFDPANSATNYLIGPGTVASGAVDFQTGSSALTFTAGQTMAFVLFGVAGTSPTPNPSAAPSSNIHEYTISNVSYLMDIAAGPDGNLWFLGSSASGNTTVTGNITTSGVTTEYTAAGGSPGSIAAGPDGRLWFTEQNSTVDAITTSGTVSTFTIGTQSFGITVGADGNLWMTDGQANAVESISPTGVPLASYPLAGTGRPSGITKGPDGALWIAEASLVQGGTPSIERVTTAGAVTAFPIPSQAYRIVAGADGNLWYSESTGNGIARITPTGTVTEFQAAVGAAVYGIAAAADGSLWATELSGNAIDHFSSSGALLNRYPLPTPNSGPNAVTIGSDGNVWFAEQAGRIGVLTP